MPYTVTEFEETPNPNAVKVWLDKPISDGRRSFLSEDAAREDPVAHALFRDAGATTVLFNGSWLTVNKTPEAKWAPIKKAIRKILSAAADTAPREVGTE